MTPEVYRPKRAKRSTAHRIRGLEYAVNEWGDPRHPLFVYLHGWGDCGATFQFVVDELQQDWFVVAPDFRGFGATDAAVGSYWFPDYLADLDRLLEIYAPEKPIRLVGHSMGANVAGLYAGSIPERVSAFVNIEGFGLADADPADAPNRYRQWMEADRSTPSFAVYRDFSQLAARIRQRNPRMSAAAAEFVARCWAEDRGGEVRLRADPRHKLPNAVLYRRAESEACWRRVAAEVLLVAGRESEFVEAFEGAGMPFPSATTANIAGAGHMLHFEAPAQLAGVIEGFFAGVDR